MSTEVTIREQALGWEYDQRNSAPDPGELEWYLKHLPRGEGRTLELGCGTGRLLLQLAAAGCMIDGIDISPAMLSQLTQKLEDTPVEIRSRVNVFASDMNHIDELAFSGRYAAIIAPYNCLQYLDSAEKIECLLSVVYSTLPVGGRFLAMTYHRDPAWYVGSTVRHFTKGRLVHPKGSWAISHHAAEYLDPTTGIVQRRLTHRLESATGDIDEWEEQTQVPLLSGSDYQSVISAAGFAVRSYNGYDERRPITAESSIACHVALKAVG